MRRVADPWGRCQQSVIPALYASTHRTHTARTHTARTLFSHDTASRELTTGFLWEKPRGTINPSYRLQARASLFYPFSVGGEVQKPFELVGMAQEIGNPLTRTGEK